MENKIRRQRNKSNCPNIEAIACYVDGILSEKKRQTLEAHIALCKSCGESIKVQKAVADSQKQEGLMFAPDYVTKRAKDLVNELIEKTEIDRALAVQIVNSMPTSIPEVRTFLGRQRIIAEDTISKILGIIEKYRVKE